MLKSGDGKNNNNHHAINNNTISSLAVQSAAHSMSATTAVALSGEYLGGDYSNNPVFMPRDRLTDGLNNITKSILQQKGVTGQLEQHDDIPLRPLLLNGSGGHNQGNAANNVQNPTNEWVYRFQFINNLSLSFFSHEYMKMVQKLDKISLQYLLSARSSRRRQRARSLSAPTHAQFPSSRASGRV